MKFVETPLKDAWLIEPQAIADERGFFARVWCSEELHEAGLSTEIAQISIAHNRYKGTIRGMHYQREPHQETKVVRCLSGSVLDVIIDIREQSTTYLQWTSVELDAERRNALYIPGGFAHGYQTLEDSTEMEYLISCPYAPDFAGGLRYDDPHLAIDWPLDPSIVSDRDQHWDLISIDQSIR